ncbi:hypothetical protein RRG08_057789 [Elysia crispata]|uniref:Uncharacterized protein n=1 Tax=Elysia crispata TaxID=231223 RepID=A0AAE1D9D4_9GAST|nr:hypothetical protein RRG08_057789 [Elysia crispata]
MQLVPENPINVSAYDLSPSSSQHSLKLFTAVLPTSFTSNRYKTKQQYHRLRYDLSESPRHLRLYSQVNIHRYSKSQTNKQRFQLHSQVISTGTQRVKLTNNASNFIHRSISTGTQRVKLTNNASNFIHRSISTGTQRVKLTNNASNFIHRSISTGQYSTGTQTNKQCFKLHSQVNILQVLKLTNSASNFIRRSIFYSAAGQDVCISGFPTPTKCRGFYQGDEEGAWKEFLLALLELASPYHTRINLTKSGSASASQPLSHPHQLDQVWLC